MSELPEGLAAAALAMVPVPMAIVDRRGEAVWTNEALDELPRTGHAGDHRLVPIPGCEGYFLRVVDARSPDLVHDERNAIHTLLLFSDLLQSLQLTGKAAEYVEVLVQQAAILRGE